MGLLDRKIRTALNELKNAYGLGGINEAIALLLKQPSQTTLSFGDVALRQGLSDFLPQDADTSTYLTRRIQLNIPVMSAAMDTVTEDALAIMVAQVGGVGTIHRNQSITREAGQVKSVKRAWNLVIDNPVTIEPNQQYRDAARLMDQTGYSGLPVVEGGFLVGIVTGKDLSFFRDNFDTPIRDMMTPVGDAFHSLGYKSGSSDADYFGQARQMFKEARVDHLPVVERSGSDLVLKGLVCHEDVNKRDRFNNASLIDDRLVVGAAVGCQYEGKDNDRERAEALVKAGADFLVIDSSHGGSLGARKMLEHLLDEYGDRVDIIAGNVCEGYVAAELAKIGAHAIKVGVGPSPICTTREETGVGTPQFSATHNCAVAVAKYGVPIITDGSLYKGGDLAKAMVAGASVGMFGSALAGTDETPGDQVTVNGKPVKLFRGMGSEAAMAMGGGADRYEDAHLLVDADLHSRTPLPQGVETTAPYRGPVQKVIENIVDGLRHGMGLMGLQTIDELRDISTFYAKFDQITANGVTESGTRELT